MWTICEAKLCCWEERKSQRCCTHIHWQDRLDSEVFKLLEAQLYDSDDHLNSWLPCVLLPWAYSRSYHFHPLYHFLWVGRGFPFSLYTYTTTRTRTNAN